MFVPLRNDILIPLGNDAFIPCGYDTLLPLGDNTEAPLLLSAEENRGCYFNSAMNVRFRTFDMRGNGGMGERSLYRRDDVGVKYNALVFCQATTYRGLLVFILRTHREHIDGEREEK